MMISPFVKYPTAFASLKNPFNLFKALSGVVSVKGRYSNKKNGKSPLSTIRGQFL